MRTYLSVFRIRLLNSLQYRATTLASILTRLVWSGMEILAYAALYRSAGEAAFPMDFSQTASYVWMQQTLIVLFSVVFGDGEIFSAIESGSISCELVRPASLYGRWFCQSAGNRVAYTAVNCLPALLIALFLPQPYGMSLPDSVGTLFLFLLSTILAVGVVVAFAMLMYISLFYTLSQRGVKIIVTAITSFLSGGVIPLPFFPKPVLAVVEKLPFAAMQNVPLRVYTGDISGMDALWGLLFQAFWLVALVLIGTAAMKRATGKVVVQGG